MSKLSNNNCVFCGLPVYNLKGTMQKIGNNYHRNLSQGTYSKLPIISYTRALFKCKVYWNKRYQLLLNSIEQLCWELFCKNMGRCFRSGYCCVIYDIKNKVESSQKCSTQFYAELKFYLNTNYQIFRAKQVQTNFLRFFKNNFFLFLLILKHFFLGYTYLHIVIFLLSKGNANLLH